MASLVTLNQIMNYAVRHRYVEFNPVNQEAACRLENVIFEKSGSKMNFAKKKGQPTLANPLLSLVPEDGIEPARV